MFITMKKTGKTVFAMFLAGAVCLPLAGADWPQFRGPNHDATSPEKIPAQWPASGLRQIWKTPLNCGFSSFTLGDGKAYTLVTRESEEGNQETCLALDAASGKELWAVPMGLGSSKYDGGGDSGAPGNDKGDGPRSTPAFDDGKVYVYSSRLVLKCVNAADGKLVWSCDLMKEHAGRNITWQSAASPLLDGDLVFVAGGGLGEALLAFDKKDGHVVWKAEDDKLTQATPIATTILGERQVVFFTSKGLVSVAPKTGAVLWRYSFPPKTAAACSPVVSGDVVYVSNSYNVGSAAVKITKADGAWTATEVWRVHSNDETSHWSTPVALNGFIYGIFGQAKFGSAPLECVDLATGEVKWQRAGFGPGGVNLVDGKLLVLSDAGDLVLVKAAADAYTEMARAHILSGKCWNSVAISNGHIYARSTKEGVALDFSANPIN
jgi:outer membrane protein assembly factor BamB